MFWTGPILDENLAPREVSEPWGPAVISTSNGALNLQSTHPVPLADPADYSHGDKTAFPIENSGFMNPIWTPSLSVPVADATIKTKVRVDTDSQAAVLMRFNGLSGYAFALSGATDEIILGRFENGVMTEVEIAPGMDFQNGKDWLMETVADGDQLSMFAWPIDGEKPAEPQIQWMDDTHPGGLIALSAERLDEQHHRTYSSQRHLRQCVNHGSHTFPFLCSYKRVGRRL